MTAPVEISLIICAHNPELPRLRRVIRSIAAQDLSASFELILVDNGSQPAIHAEMVEAIDGVEQILVHEPRLGLVFARKAGIEASSADVLCFVDDDNILATDYLTSALKIAAQEKDLGAFGGRSIARLARNPDWLLQHFLARYAVREYREPVTISRPTRELRGYEPFGAGMVVRRPVAERFSDMIGTLKEGLTLGRAGRELGSGEDSIFTRIAFSLGYKVGYRPQLELAHEISAERLKWAYLKRLLEGQARAEAVLDALDGFALPVLSTSETLQPQIRIIRFTRRLLTIGLAEAVGLHFWDDAYVKYRRQAEQLAHAISATYAMPRAIHQRTN